MQLQLQVEQQMQVYTQRTEDIVDIVIVPKPSPRGEPLVWADRRQELCEGLTYFRQYQSGIQAKNNIVSGYLLDGYGAERDFIGSHVVISHGFLL